MGTRMYLKVNANKGVTLTEDHLDPTTVFRLHPVIKVKHKLEITILTHPEMADVNC